jgi:hypothetical protein
VRFFARRSDSFRLIISSSRRRKSAAEVSEDGVACNGTATSGGDGASAFEFFAAGWKIPAIVELLLQPRKLGAQGVFGQFRQRQSRWIPGQVDDGVTGLVD